MRRLLETGNKGIPTGRRSLLRFLRRVLDAGASPIPSRPRPPRRRGRAGEERVRTAVVDAICDQCDEVATMFIRHPAVNFCDDHRRKFVRSNAQRRGRILVGIATKLAARYAARAAGKCK